MQDPTFEAFLAQPLRNRYDLLPEVDGHVFLLGKCAVARRNIDPFPFPPFTLETMGCSAEISTAILAAAAKLPARPWTVQIPVRDLTPLQRAYLAFYLCCPDLFGTTPGDQRLLASPSGNSICRINAENHLEIASFCPADVPIADAVRHVMQPLSHLEKSLTFARHSFFGYLTKQAGLCGTGLSVRANVAIPALILSGCDKQLQRAAFELDLKVRFNKINKTEFVTYIATVQADPVLGRPVEDIVRTFESFLSILKEREQHARDTLLAKDNRIVMQDKIVRALAILSNAFLLPTHEALAELSVVWFGLENGLIQRMETFRDHLLQPLYRKLLFQQHLDSLVQQKDIPRSHQELRAKALKKCLKKPDEFRPEDFPLFSY